VFIGAVGPIGSDSGRVVKRTAGKDHRPNKKKPAQTRRQRNPGRHDQGQRPQKKTQKNWAASTRNRKKTRPKKPKALITTAETMTKGGQNDRGQCPTNRRPLVNCHDQTRPKGGQKFRKGLEGGGGVRLLVPEPIPKDANQKRGFSSSRSRSLKGQTPRAKRNCSVFRKNIKQIRPFWGIGGIRRRLPGKTIQVMREETTALRIM